LTGAAGTDDGEDAEIAAVSVAGARPVVREAEAMIVLRRVRVALAAVLPADEPRRVEEGRALRAATLPLGRAAATSPVPRARARTDAGFSDRVGAATLLAVGLGERASCAILRVSRLRDSRFVLERGEEFEELMTAIITLR
jgi:hypothetical protein